MGKRYESSCEGWVSRLGIINMVRSAPQVVSIPIGHNLPLGSRDCEREIKKKTREYRD